MSTMKMKVAATCTAFLMAVGVTAVTATASSASTATPFTFTLDKSSTTYVTVNGKKLNPGKSITVKSAAPKVFFGANGNYCNMKATNTFTYKNGSKKTTKTSLTSKNNTSWGSGKTTKSTKVNLKITNCVKKSNVSVTTGRSISSVKIGYNRSAYSTKANATILTPVNKKIPLTVNTTKKCTIAVHSGNKISYSNKYLKSTKFSVPYSTKVKVYLTRCK